MTSPLEKSVVASLTAKLRARGAYVVKHHGSQFGTQGTPDLLVCYRGRFVAIEVKRDAKTKPTALQRLALEAASRAGALALCAWRWDEVEDALDEIDLSFDRLGADHPMELHP